MPTPPAMNTTFSILAGSIPGGGQTKVPPAFMTSSDPKILGDACHNHAAGGFLGDAWIASSRYPSFCSRSLGVDVIVNPPACGMPGTCTSSHWPGRNCTVGVEGQQKDISAYGLSCLYRLLYFGCVGLQSQQADIVVDLIDLVKYDRMQARLPSFCSCALFMSRGRHRS